MRGLALLVALFIVAGCPRSSPAAVTRIVAVSTVEPDVLSPLLSESGGAHEVMALFARDLVITDPTWHVVPDLAARVPSLDNGDARLVDGKLVVTWHIRGDAFWEDGQPVVAADFITGWRFQADAAQETVVGRDDAQRIESIVADGDATSARAFTVTWREPNPFFAQPRVHRPLAYHRLAKRIVTANGALPLLKNDPLARAPLSNGPFKLKEHAPGQHLLFVRNDAYRPRALVDEVLVKIAPSTSTALAMIAARQADLVFPSGGPSPVEARAFATSSTTPVKLAQVPGQVWTHIDFNLDDPWLADVRVRRALAHALPREEIFRAISGGLYEVSHSYLPPRHWGHSAAVAPLTFDVELARKLLDDAGFAVAPDGMRRNADGDALKLEIAAASEVKESAELLQHCVKAWRDVGVDVVLDLRPFKVFFGEGARKRKLKHMSFYSWTLDGTSMGGALWRRDKIPSADNGFKGQNLPGWKNDEATRLLIEADSTMDLAARKQKLARVQELVRAELPAIPMYFRPVVVVHSASVQGIAPTGTLTPLAWNAHAWSKSR